MTNDYSTRKIACQQAVNTLVAMIKCIDHAVNGIVIDGLHLNNSEAELADLQAHYLLLKAKLPNFFSEM